MPAVGIPYTVGPGGVVQVQRAQAAVLGPLRRPGWRVWPLSRSAGSLAGVAAAAGLGARCRAVAGRGIPKRRSVRLRSAADTAAEPRPRVAFLIGGPGSGKGTQAE